MFVEDEAGIDLNGLRPKQAEIFHWFRKHNHAVVKLPGGYGKTLAAASAYAALRSRGAANRMLVIVPRRTQATQALGLPQDLGKFFGIDTKAISLENTKQAMDCHRDGIAEVFIVTVQSLLFQAGWATCKHLLSSGNWFVVIDEHHHYGDNGKWIEQIKALNAPALLAMSATPNRHDGTDHFPDPDISETYIRASNNGFVKPMRLHAYDYKVHFVHNGEVYSFTLSELAAEVGSQDPEAIAKWISTRRMRWRSEYVYPLLEAPLDRLRDLAVYGVKGQMLICAMTCEHAKVVCEQIKTLTAGSTITVDWVGTGPEGRLDPDNDQVLRRFCPPKDAHGIRNWDLDILVNVGLAGEGLDAVDVVEVVFLEPANPTITTKQKMLRGARISKSPYCKACTINVDASSKLSENKYLDSGIMTVFDEPHEITDEDEEEAKRKQREASDEPLAETLLSSLSILKVELLDIRKVPYFQKLVDESIKEHVSEEMAERIVERLLREHLGRGSASDLTGDIRMLRGEVKRAGARVVGNVLKILIGRSGNKWTEQQKKETVRELRIRVNTLGKSKFGEIDGLLPDQLEIYWQWLRVVQAEILAGEIPSWLR